MTAEGGGPTVVVIGLGAVGSLIARALAAGGAVVLGVDPDPRQEPSLSSWRRAADVPAARYRESIAAIIATRAPDAARAIEGVPPELPLITVYNGVDRGAGRGRSGRVLRGVVDFAASRIGDRVLCTRPGTVHFERAPATEALARAFGPGPVLAVTTDQIERHLWGKILFNAGLDPVAALTGRTYGGVLAGWRSFRLFRELYLEGCGIARALSIEPSPVQGTRPYRLARVLATPVLGRLAGWAAGWAARKVESTMLADVRSGRPTEVRFLNGFLVEEAERAGVPAHHHRAILERFDADGRLLRGGI